MSSSDSTTSRHSGDVSAFTAMAPTPTTAAVPAVGKKVRFYQEALGEAEVEAKKAKEAASVATKKAEEERALKEAAEKEVAELQALHRQHLRTAVADDRPPRAERSRSRSPLMTTAWSITPTTAEILRIDVTQPPATQHPPPPADQGYEVQEQNHEAAGPLRRMPKCKRRCCYQPSADPERPRPPEGRGNFKDLAQCFKKRTMAQKNTNVHEDNEGLLHGSSWTWRADRIGLHRSPGCLFDRLEREKNAQLMAEPEHPAPHFIRGALWNTCGCSVRSNNVKTGTKGREAPWPPE
uniref:Uncharacterized protein n=1 Tax=Bursaphelenchus xylophilus TaxID=6326 RepID=A0A1I7S0U3_BURXY